MCTEHPPSEVGGGGGTPPPRDLCQCPDPNDSEPTRFTLHFRELDVEKALPEHLLGVPDGHRGPVEARLPARHHRFVVRPVIAADRRPRARLDAVLVGDLETTLPCCLPTTEADFPL